MKGEEKNDEIIHQGVYIICRDCGCEYIERKDWISEFPRKTECPLCNVKVILS